MVAAAMVTAGCGGAGSGARAAGTGVKPGAAEMTMAEGKAELLASVQGLLVGTGTNYDERKAHFDRARLALGDRFEAELLKMVRGDVSRHYYTSMFAADGNRALGLPRWPQLALLLMQEGLVLCEKLPADERPHEEIPMSVIAAVQARGLGFDDLAVSYKLRAEKGMSAQGDSADFPAMPEEEQNLYEGIRIDKG